MRAEEDFVRVGRLKNVGPSEQGVIRFCAVDVARKSATCRGREGHSTVEGHAVRRKGAEASGGCGMPENRSDIYVGTSLMSVRVLGSHWPEGRQNPSA